MHTAIRGIMAAILTALAACSHDPEPPAANAPAVAADRPLDDPSNTAESLAARTAALVESALVQVRSADLERCLADFQGGADGTHRPAHTYQRAWLVVAASLPADGPVFALRREVAPELNPEPEDGWQDRITYRTLLRSPDPADGSVACLSCVFDYSRGAVVYQHAYGLDTCPSTVPGERELAVKLSVG